MAMKAIKLILVFVLLCCNTTLVSAQYITVDDTKTAQQLVENVLVNSSCANVSNFSASGDTNVPFGQNSYGYFTNAGGSFPFNEGILLSTQYAKKSIGPYNWDKGNDNDGPWLGDADLNQALGISTTVNATILEFDFIPLTNFLSFDYIFASIEYADTGSCRYTDAFAFLIKENISGSVYQNLAVIAGTSNPVSSTNIRPTIPPSGIYSGCSAVNQQYFNGFNNNSSPINYAGQTVVMNSQTVVDVGKTYHIKLVIANDGNEFYDSAVFLKAGSFSPRIDLGPDRNLAANNPVCFGESFTIDTKLPVTYDYKWYKDGVEIPLKTEPFLNITASGTYKVEVIFSPATCMATSEITLEYAPEILLSNATLVQCDDNGDGITVFDLTKVDNIVKNNNASLNPVVYYETLPDAKGKINPIVNPATYTNTFANPPLYARVTNSFGCANYAKVDLVISNNSIAPQSPVATCDGDAVQDGLYQFDLNAQATPQVLNGLPNGLMVEYYLISTDAVSQKNRLPNIFNNTTPNLQIIHARIVNGPDCYGITPITLVVNTFDPPNFQDESSALCEGASLNLSVSTGFSGYLWDTGAITNTITVTAPGSYSVKVTDATGCTKTKKFTVTASGIATITGAAINDFAGNENSVLIQFTGAGNYEFSLDGTYFQDNPLFTGIAPGTYLASARDKNDCGLSNPYVIYVLDYPRYFTPNGDDFNDVWEIKNLELLPNFTLTVFDRYGNLLKELTATNSSWNGTFNQHLLPATDYWFHLALEGGKIIKGHFSLKR